MKNVSERLTCSFTQGISSQSIDCLSAQQKMGIRAYKSPSNGVKELISQDRIARTTGERPGTRQKHGSDSLQRWHTVRSDATNSPLTQFKPSWIGTSIEKVAQEPRLYS